MDLNLPVGALWKVEHNAAAQQQAPLQRGPWKQYVRDPAEHVYKCQTHRA